MQEWINIAGVVVTAAATAASAIFSYFLFKLGREQMLATQESVRISAAIRDIERQRDTQDDPLIYLFFHGYEADGHGHFILQNSGKRSLFLSSLAVDVINAKGQTVILNGKISEEGTIKDVVVHPENPLSVRFLPKGASGCLRFDLYFQLYTGDPARIRVDPTIHNGYVIRVPGSSALKIEARAHQL